MVVTGVFRTEFLMAIIAINFINHNAFNKISLSHRGSLSPLSLLYPNEKTITVFWEALQEAKELEFIIRVEDGRIGPDVIQEVETLLGIYAFE